VFSENEKKGLFSMESLVQSYTGGWGVQVVHAPLHPASKEWAQKIDETVRTHPQGAMFSKLGVFGFFTKNNEKLQDASSAVTQGAAESAAASQVAAYASGRLKGFCAPVPGICWLVGGHQRAYCASSGQKANDPVALHVVSAPTPLTVTFLAAAAAESVDGAQEEWHAKMGGTNPIWWTQKGPCGQILFPAAVNEALLKREEEKVTLSLQEGDTLVVAPGTPLWFESEKMAILHSTTFARVPEGDPNMESAASEWFRFYRSNGGICDPGPDYRSGAAFIPAKGLPPFVSDRPAFPLDTSLVFDVDVTALTAKPAKITSTELELLFWIGFVHKLVAAFKLLESGLWSADIESKHREHLADWLQFFQAPDGKIKRIIKTSTVRSALSTLCDTLEKLASRALFFKEWVPRFEAAAPILAAINFSTGTSIELKNQHRETLRVFRDLQKLANWPKVFQQGKDSLIQGAVEQAEQLIKADPNRWPQNPRAWLDKKRESLADFRGDPNIPQEKVDLLQTMLSLADEDADTSAFLSIDRDFHELMRLFDPSYGPYVPPYPTASTTTTTTTKSAKPKKRSRSPSLADGDDEEGESIGNSEDDNEEENELPLGTIVRDIMAKQWKATVPTVKTECSVCQKTTIPLAFSYCVDCCNEDLNALIHQSLKAGLTVMMKNGGGGGGGGIEEFAKRVKALKKKEEDNEHVFGSGVGRATQVKVFKELLDEFAALEHDFATQGVVLAEHEDSQDLEEYGDESPMSEDHEDEDEEEEEEEEEDEEEESNSSSGSSDRRVSKKARSEGPELLALDLLRLRTERGLFVTRQEEMEALCLAGDEKSVVAARVFLDKLKSLPSQWCVEMTDLESKSTPQMCDSLGWFETEREAVKAKIIHEAMHSHLKGQVAFSVREKKNSPQ
jgi:hypothetical protein